MNILQEVNRALFYTKQKFYFEAEKIYKTILAKDSENPTIMSMLGLLYIEMGLFKKAEKILKKSSIKKQSIPTIEGLALAKYHLNKADAIEYFEQVIDKTKNFEVYQSYINLLLKIKKYQLASEYSEKFVELFPLKKEAASILIESYISIGKLKEAYSLSLKLVNNFQKYSDAWFWLGLCYEMLFHDEDGAKNCYEKVLECGDKTVGYYNLAVNSIKRDDYDAALIYLNRLKRLKGANFNNNFTYANVYMKKREFKKGIKYYSKHIYSGLLSDKRTSKIFLNKLWDGKMHKDKILFIYGDQGIGDLIMFSRYIPFIANKFKFIKVFVRKNIIHLFRNSFKEYKNVLFYTYKIRDFDYSAILSCLPYYLKMDYNSIPFSNGYFKAENKKITKYKEVVVSKKLKVGICWEAGAAGWREQLNRTMHISLFEDILNNKNMQIYSLQVKPSLDNYKDYKNIVDLGKDFRDFSDTAGALKNLDVIVTVDTSVAHLAGALGVKTFMLLPYCPDWRWFDDEKTTSWYNSVTIFKQRNPKSWDDVFVNISNELRNLYLKK